ncbi:MAG: Nif3-like dinuclear metal center hexameric protein [Firmicutes bacterium]|nr:Nif3-like dinuclear metal center hexameric protein [Bacillota bacterium]
MRLAEVEEFIESLFDTRRNDCFDRESGVTVRGAEEFKKVGYCTNLTLDTVEEAIQNDVDLMVTHHDAWDGMFGLKEACLERLLEAGVSHYFNHLPLDDCDFGTNNSLAEKLGLRILEKSHLEDGFYCGRIAEFSEATTLEELVGRLELLLEEPVQVWKFRGGPIRRVGLVCGNGLSNRQPHVHRSVWCRKPRKKNQDEISGYGDRQVDGRSS